MVKKWKTRWKNNITLQFLFIPLQYKKGKKTFPPLVACVWKNPSKKKFSHTIGKIAQIFRRRDTKQVISGSCVEGKENGKKGNFLLHSSIIEYCVFVGHISNAYTTLYIYGINTSVYTLYIHKLGPRGIGDSKENKDCWKNSMAEICLLFFTSGEIPQNFRVSIISSNCSNGPTSGFKFFQLLEQAFGNVHAFALFLHGLSQMAHGHRR